MTTLDYSATMTSADCPAAIIERDWYDRLLNSLAHYLDFLDVNLGCAVAEARSRRGSIQQGIAPFRSSLGAWVSVVYVLLFRQ